MDTVPDALNDFVGQPIAFGPQWEPMKRDDGFRGRVEMQLPRSGITRGELNYAAGRYCVESSEHWGVGLVRRPFDPEHCAFGTTTSTGRGVSASELIVSEPGAGFDAKLQTGTTIEYVLISRERFAQALPESFHGLNGLPKGGDTYLSSPLLLHLVHALLDHLRHSQHVFDFYTDTLADAIIAELSRGGATRNPDRRDRARTLSRKDLTAATDYIQRHLHTKIPLDRLAGVTKRNASTIRKGFRELTGKTPYQYILDARVERARGMSATTGTSLAKVAFDCGFSSQSHMTDVFRKKLSMTPGEIRNRAWGGRSLF